MGELSLFGIPLFTLFDTYCKDINEKIVTDVNIIVYFYVFKDLTG